jgi:hypothetical protein
MALEHPLPEQSFPLQEQCQQMSSKQQLRRFVLETHNAYAFLPDGSFARLEFTSLGKAAGQVSLCTIRQLMILGFKLPIENGKNELLTNGETMCCAQLGSAMSHVCPTFS